MRLRWIGLVLKVYELPESYRSLIIGKAFRDYQNFMSNAYPMGFGKMLSQRCVNEHDRIKVSAEIFSEIDDSLFSISKYTCLSDINFNGKNFNSKIIK